MRGRPPPGAAAAEWAARGMGGVPLPCHVRPPSDEVSIFLTGVVCPAAAEGAVHTANRLSAAAVASTGGAGTGAPVPAPPGRQGPGTPVHAPPPPTRPPHSRTRAPPPPGRGPARFPSTPRPATATA